MRLRLLTFVIVLAIGLLALMAWQRNTARTMPPAEVPAPGNPPNAGQAPSPAHDPGLEWQVPRRWVAELAQGMRLASYAIPPADGKGEAAQCAVYYFGPGQGGGVEANVERWIGEFERPGTPARRTRHVRGVRVSQVEVTGAYTAHAGGMGDAGPASSGWTLLGAIVEGPAGAVFFKLAGPEATVAAAKKEFDDLLASLRKK